MYLYLLFRLQVVKTDVCIVKVQFIQQYSIKYKCLKTKGTEEQTGSFAVLVKLQGFVGNKVFFELQDC